VSNAVHAAFPFRRTGRRRAAVISGHAWDHVQFVWFWSPLRLNNRAAHPLSSKPRLTNIIHLTRLCLNRGLCEPCCHRPSRCCAGPPDGSMVSSWMLLQTEIIRTARKMQLTDFAGRRNPARGWGYSFSGLDRSHVYGAQVRLD
jgi:hypothetical protein